MEKKIKIIKKNCPQSHPCRAVKACPVFALSQKEKDVPQINADQCIKCGKCVRLCPKKVFVLE